MFQEHRDETQHTPIQKRILQEVIASQKLKQINPQDSQDSRHYVLSNFDWTDLTLDKQAREVIEKKRVEIHDIHKAQIRHWH